MRALAFVLCAELDLVTTGCRPYDPIAEVPHRHREVPDTAAAIATILAENPAPRVYAVGEYHQTRKARSATSSLTRFTREIITQLQPHASHLVVEAWLDANCWGETAKQVAVDLQRPAGVAMEVMRLVERGRRLDMQTHTLPMTCIEYDAVIDASGHVNFWLLLQLVTEKLAETTRALLGGHERAVIVYGGALHNDLFPRWPLDELSYARALANELPAGGVLEIDLVVPEVVAPLPSIRNEPWFPLLGRASPSRALIWRRGASSYVVILPAQSEEVARVAKLDDPM